VVGGVAEVGVLRLGLVALEGDVSKAVLVSGGSSERRVVIAPTPAATATMVSPQATAARRETSSRSA